VGVHMSRSVPEGSAVVIGSDAKPAKTLTAHAFQENLCHGKEPRPGVPWPWWVYFPSLHDDGTIFFGKAA
jgi:hypothetical protein